MNGAAWQVGQKRKRRDTDSFEQVVLFVAPERLGLIKWNRTSVQIALDFPEDCNQLSSPLT
jgi:hypothetical protein